jgi:NOL1/NOP2/fmu family ribosome biogenesis protein
LMAGTAVLEIMKNKFVPDHALSLSTSINKNFFKRVALDQNTALQYLRKDPVTLQGDMGFNLVEYNGFRLGWVNILQNRVNNLYPSSWRIRMGPVPG